MMAAGAIVNDQGQMSGARVEIAAASMSNRGGVLMQTGAGSTDISVSGSFDNTNGAIATNA